MQPVQSNRLKEPKVNDQGPHIKEQEIKGIELPLYGGEADSLPHADTPFMAGGVKGREKSRNGYVRLPAVNMPHHANIV
jgi:hypothetical protein